jgi:hypothetical protein
LIRQVPRSKKTYALICFDPGESPVSHLFGAGHVTYSSAFAEKDTARTIFFNKIIAQ